MRILIAAALVVALAALGLVTVPYAVTWERYRPDIETHFEKMTGYDVTIAGPIDVAFLPKPRLVASDVSVTGREEDQAGFELRSWQVDIGFQTGPLIVGRPIVDQLKINRPELVLDQETSDKITSWPPRLDVWSQFFFGSELQRISIDEGRLRLGSGDTSNEATVSDLSLTLARAADEGPIEAAGLFKALDHRFSIAAEIGVPGRTGSSTIKMDIGAANGTENTTTLKLNGVLQREGPNAGLQGKLDLAGPDLQDGLKTISSLTDKPSSYLSLATDQPFRIETDVKITKNLVAAERARITLNEKLGDGQLAVRLGPTPTLDLRIDLASLQLADDRAFVDFVPLDLLSLFPSTPGRVDVGLREILYREKAIRRAAVTIVTESGGLSHVERAKALFPGLVDVHFKGRLKPSESGHVLSGELTSVGDDLGETLHWLGLPLAEQGEGWHGFNFESNVDVSNVEVALSAIDMRLDTSKIEGEANLRFSERMILGLDLDVERLNLDAYASENGDIAEFAAFIDEQFEHLDASIDARFERLSWRGLRFEEGALQAKLERQRLSLTTLALRTIGATTLTIDGGIDLQSGSVDLATAFESEFPTRFLRHLDIRLPFAAARPKPLTVSGSITGDLADFETSLRADYDSGQWLVKGQAGWTGDRPHYDLTINAEHPDHRALAGHFGLAPLVPDNDAPGSFNLDGQLSYNQESTWTVAGNVKLGPTSITGRLAHQEAEEKGAWEARVSIGNPQKDSLAPFLALIGYRSTGNWTPASILGRLPGTALRTTWLDRIEGTLSLAARGGLAGQGMALSARVDEGRLDIDEFEADLWNGGLTAELSLERRNGQPVTSFEIELDEVDAHAFTSWLNVPKTIEAPLTLKLDATSVGQTVFDLVKGLSGSLDIEIDQGILHGTGIPGLRKHLRDNLDPGPVTTAASSDDPLIMPLTRLKASTSVKRGIATVDAGHFVFDTGLGVNAEATMGGTLDLLLWIAELSLGITTDDGSKPPMELRIVGSPSEPQGVFLSP